MLTTTLVEPLEQGKTSSVRLYPGGIRYVDDYDMRAEASHQGEATLNIDVLRWYGVTVEGGCFA
jgi:hypothetical protein